MSLLLALRGVYEPYTIRWVAAARRRAFQAIASRVFLQLMFVFEFAFAVSSFPPFGLLGPSRTQTLALAALT